MGEVFVVCHSVCRLNIKYTLLFIIGKLRKIIEVNHALLHYC